MTSAQVVETLVKVTPNSPSQDYTHPDDHNLRTYDITPGFKPFTVYLTFITGTSQTASTSQQKATEKKNDRWNVQNKDPIIGYIQNVSVLKGSRNKFKYFNFDIQTENDFLQGVCNEQYLLSGISRKQEAQKHKQMKTCIDNLSLDEACLCMDYAESYQCGFQHEVQSAGDSSPHDGLLSKGC